MDTTKLADVIINSLQFNAFMLTLLLGFHGFAVGRLWKEKRLLPPVELLWLAPGFIGAIYCLYLIADGYSGIGRALSERKVLDFYTDWLNHYWRFYVALATTTFASTAGFAIALKRGG